MALTTEQKYLIGGGVILALIGYAWWSQKTAAAAVTPPAAPPQPLPAPQQAPMTVVTPVTQPVPVPAPAPAPSPSPAPVPAGSVPAGSSVPAGTMPFQPIPAPTLTAPTLPTATATSVAAGTMVYQGNTATDAQWALPFSVTFSDGTTETSGYVNFSRLGWHSQAQPDAGTQTMMRSYLYNFIGHTKDQIAPMQDAE